jgi:hypothetical protein
MNDLSSSASLKSEIRSRRAGTKPETNDKQQTETSGLAAERQTPVAATGNGSCCFLLFAVCRLFRISSFGFRI